MALQLAALGVVSLIAHFEKNSIMWIVAGAMAVFTGFYWFDRFTDNLGLAFGICFIVYGLVCLSTAFINLFVTVRERFTRSDN